MEMTDEERRYQIVKRTEYEEQVESKKKLINKYQFFSALYFFIAGCSTFAYLYGLSEAILSNQLVSYMKEYLRFYLYIYAISNYVSVLAALGVKSLSEEKGKLIGKIELIDEMLGISSDEYENDIEKKGKTRKLTMDEDDH